MDGCECKELQMVGRTYYCRNKVQCSPYKLIILQICLLFINLSVIPFVYYSKKVIKRWKTLHNDYCVPPVLLQLGWEMISSLISVGDLPETQTQTQTQNGVWFAIYKPRYTIILLAREVVSFSLLTSQPTPRQSVSQSPDKSSVTPMCFSRSLADTLHRKRLLFKGN